MTGQHRAVRRPMPLRDHFGWTVAATSLVLGTVVLGHGITQLAPLPGAASAGPGIAVERVGAAAAVLGAGTAAAVTR